jgi:DMSO/TMAO reductase YedYZ molybdopterin-dependent catalytic subunit
MFALKGPSTRLPPGQRAVVGFPRFGIDLKSPPPATASEISIDIIGALTSPLLVTRPLLDTVPRTVVDADFHCVAGWSAVDLTWEGWSFHDVLNRLILPQAVDGDRVRFLVFVGVDGYRAIVRREDAERANVLLADRLHGTPLSAEHGAPVRLVSPDQYGYLNTKHLVRIELHTEEPEPVFHPRRSVQRALRAVHPHGRALVWSEERHRYLPSWLTRSLYRLVVRLPAPPADQSAD